MGRRITPSATVQTILPIDIEDDRGRKIRHRERAAVTFKGGLNRYAHRWFRLTPSFSPQLVADLLQEFGKSETIVLDPFAGRGTTLIECKLRGVPSVGVDINPVLQFVAQVSLNWSVPLQETRTARDSILASASELSSSTAHLSPQATADLLGVPFPQLYNITRWWRDDVLRDLLIYRTLVEQKSANSLTRNFLLLALLNILIDAANITLGRLQFHFIDRSQAAINIHKLFAGASSMMLSDLEALQEFEQTQDSAVLLGDSRQINKLKLNITPNLVITSPPYPNRYSYVWNTRPHLYFLNFFSTSRQAGDLDCNTIGGTWGSATSRHMKRPYSFINLEAERVTAEIVKEIRAKDLLMSNYVAMYFDDLYSQINSMKSVVSSDAICAFVVGNSRIRKSIVETDSILGNLFMCAGFSSLKIEEIRRRNSGRELHETVVIVQNLA